MEFYTILRGGGRIRHCDWPPFHFAELRPLHDGRTRLCRVTPNGEVEPIDVVLDGLHEGDGWSALDTRPDQDGDLLR